MINHHAYAADYAIARQDARIAAAEHARLVREAGPNRRGTGSAWHLSLVDRVFGALRQGVRHGGSVRPVPARPMGAVSSVVAS